MRQAKIMECIQAEDRGLELLVEDMSSEEGLDNFEREYTIAFDILEALGLDRAAKALVLGVVQSKRALMQREEDGGE